MSAARVHYSPDSGNSWVPAGGQAVGFSNAAVVTPNDNTPLASPAQALWVQNTAAGAGTVIVVTAGGQTVAIPIPASSVVQVPIAVTTVKATGTSLTGTIIALW